MSKEYTLIGGNGTVVSPLEVTEDGDYVAGDSRAFNPVKVRTGGGGSSTLSGLTDVDISNPTDGQTLVYDAASSKWVNGSGGGVLVVNAPLIDGVATLDKTWQEICDAVYAVARTRNIGEGYDMWAYDPVSAVGESESKYFVETVGGYIFLADSTDDYPVTNSISPE